MTRRPRSPAAAWCCAAVALALAFAAAPGLARPAKGAKSKPAAPVTPPPPPPDVPLLSSSRPDGLRVVAVSAPGPAVSIRLLVNLSRLNARHAQSGAAAVTASAVLHGGAPGEALGQGGARRVVDTVDDSVVLGVDTVRERWRDDLTAFLRAVSNPALDETALGAATLRTLAFGPSHNVDALMRRVQFRADGRDPALFTEERGARLNLEAAVWHLEEAWSSDRMTLVVVGSVPQPELLAVVEEQFLVPPLATPLELPAPPPGTRLQPEDNSGSGPSHLVVGQYARDLRPPDVLVLTALLQARLDADAPRAGTCVVRYHPSAVEPTVLAACTAVGGVALDVRNVLLRGLEPGAATPTPAELKAARQAALGALKADHASAPLLAARLCAWATAGLDGGDGLEAAVAGTSDEALLAAFTQLMEPQRALRVLHRGQGGVRP